MSTAAARCASSARRSWYGVHCRIDARPSAAASANRWQVSKPQARQSHGRPLGPSPIWLQDRRHRLGVGHRPPRLEREDRARRSPPPSASTTGCRLRGGSALASSSRRQYSSSCGPEQRMVQRPLGREDVHEAQVEPVHRHRPRHRRERVEPADLPEPPARVARLLQQRQRQPARRAQVPPPLLRHPLEEASAAPARSPRGCGRAGPDRRT